MYSDGAPKDVLRSILNGKLMHAADASAFANDTVFCEWAYFIDFAEGRIDVHVDGSSEVLDSRSFAEASEEWMWELSGSSDGERADGEGDGGSCAKHDRIWPVKRI